MNRDLERRLLQLAIGLACFVPLAAGGTGVIESAAMVKGVEPPLPTDLDSHFRYLSGLLLGIGLGFWSTVPAIETKTTRFGLLTALVVLGGLGRLASLVGAGWPSGPMLGGLLMELVVTPLLCLWQRRLHNNVRLVGREEPGPPPRSGPSYA